MTPAPRAVGDILVLRPGALGDLLLTLPAIRALREGFAPARLVVGGHPSAVRLLPPAGLADEVFDIGSARASALFAPGEEIPEPERAFFGGFDLILAYVGADEPMRRRLALGLRPSPVPAGRRVLLAEAVAPPGGPHAADFLARPLARWSIGVAEATPILRPPLPDSARSGVSIHPGAGSPAKRWPVEGFAAVGREWLTRGAAVTILEGPAEAESGVCAALLRRLPEAAPFRSDDLAAVADLLARSRLHLGNDSGITHLAASVGTPVVALHGPTDPAVWGARGERAFPLRAAGGRLDLEALPAAVVRNATFRAAAG